MSSLEPQPDLGKMDDFSLLYHLHIFYKLNSSYDKFDINKHTIRWLIDNKLYKIQDKYHKNSFRV